MLGVEGGGVIWTIAAARPSVASFQKWIFLWKTRLKTNTEIDINNLIPDLIKIHACVYRY